MKTKEILEGLEIKFEENNEKKLIPKKLVIIKRLRENKNLIPSIKEIKNSAEQKCNIIISWSEFSDCGDYLESNITSFLTPKRK